MLQKMPRERERERQGREGERKRERDRERMKDQIAAWTDRTLSRESVWFVGLLIFYDGSN